MVVFSNNNAQRNLYLDLCTNWTKRAALSTGFLPKLELMRSSCTLFN